MTTTKIDSLIDALVEDVSVGKGPHPPSRASLVSAIAAYARQEREGGREDVFDRIRALSSPPSPARGMPTCSVIGPDGEACGLPFHGGHIDTVSAHRWPAPSRSEETGDAPDMRPCANCGDLACLHREDGCHANESAAGCYVKCKRFVPPPGVLTVTIPAAPQMPTVRKGTDCCAHDWRMKGTPDRLPGFVRWCDAIPLGSAQCPKEHECGTFVCPAWRWFTSGDGQPPSTDTAGKEE